MVCICHFHLSACEYKLFFSFETDKRKYEFSSNKPLFSWTVTATFFAILINHFRNTGLQYNKSNAK